MSEIKSQFFNGKTYSAVDFVESNKNTMKDGILPNTDFFKILPASNMTIGVTSGRGWLQGHAFSSDATLAFTLTNADGVLDRVDTIVIRLDLTTDNEKIECRVIKGALGGSATAPVRDGTYYDLVIAQIAIAHGTTAITAAMITDKRGDGNLCGWSGAISGDQFNFEEKADKTYCDETFLTLSSAANGDKTINANKMKGVNVSTLTGNGVLVKQNNSINLLDTNTFLLNAVGSNAQTGAVIGYTIAGSGYDKYEVVFSATDLGTNNVHTISFNIDKGETTRQRISIPFYSFTQTTDFTLAIASAGTSATLTIVSSIETPTESAHGTYFTLKIRGRI